MSSSADRIILALLDNPDGLTREKLRAEAGVSTTGFNGSLGAARKKAYEIGAVIPRSVHPDYVYQLVDKDNPDSPAYKASAGVDIKDMITRLIRIHRDAATMTLVIDGRTRDGKLVSIIAKQVGRAVEDITEAQDDLVGAS